MTDYDCFMRILIVICKLYLYYLTPSGEIDLSATSALFVPKCRQSLVGRHG